MPQILMIVGAILVLAGMGSIAAGAPDWVLGLSLGAALIQSGTVALVGGIVLIALAQVLNALQDLTRKLDAAGAPVARTAPAAAERAQPPAQRQPAPEEAPQRQREPAMPAAAEDAPRARRDAPPNIQGEQPQPQRPRREPASGFPSDDQMRIRREPPPQHGEEPRPRRETPPPPADEDSPRPRHSLEHASDELARLRGDYSAGRRREEPLRTPRDTPPLPPLPQVPASDERRRPRSGGDEQGEFMPRFRPIDPTPSAPVRNPASETVVRSGVIGGMAYTLYADGSIEAELAIGTVRFGSIAELQDHVTRTGAESEVDFKESSR